MIIIACVDNNFGIKFNNRRQSEDREVIKRIYKITKGKKLFIEGFSKDLFPKDMIEIRDKFPYSANLDDYIFIENPDFCDFSKVDKIILFFWNTVYPYDQKFPLPTNYGIVKRSDFKGYSHNNITEVWYEKM